MATKLRTLLVDRTRAPIVATAGLLALAFALALVLVFRFVAAESAREERAWQARLGLIADGRAAAVGRWIEGQYGELAGLAQNPALQIYMTALGGAADREAEEAYLRILLAVTAERAGFLPARPPAALPTEARRTGTAGLVLVGRDRRPVAATDGAPPLEGTFATFVQSARPGERAFLDMERGPNGQARVAFLVPVFAVQGGSRPSDQIGAVLGVREVGPDLFGLLPQPGAAERTLEVMLLRAAGAAVDYLSPLMDGSGPLERSLARRTRGLAEAALVENPGGFEIGRDYRDVEVVATGRGVPGVPWTLVVKLDRDEALGDSDARLRRLLAGLLLIVAAVAAGLVAAWRHGASRRALDLMERYRDLAGRHETQGRFLRLVTDSQPNVVFVAGKDGRYRFANRLAAERARMDAADMIGKTMAAVLGPDGAKRTLALNERALATRAVARAVERVEEDGVWRIVQSVHVPLGETGREPDAVLVVEEDVTDVVTERERRARTLRGLVGTLLAVVDRRDPHAANHSARVGEVARAVAGAMGLDPVEIETAEFVGILMNLGKILVPEAVLTRSGPLNDDERQHVRDSVQASADLVAEVEFDGPVAEALRQAHERWDGTGPRGRAGEDILLAARVAAVANAFVAMVSPRAHRAGLSENRAIETLLGEIGHAYDRGVVAALVLHLDGRGRGAAA